MTVTLLPSGEVAMVSFLKNDPDVSAIVAGRVGTGLNKTMPCIRLARVGSAPPEPWQDNAEIQVECWAADQGTADKLGRTVVAVMPRIRQWPTSAGDGLVHAYEVTSGPFWSPDDPSLTGAPRYILTVNLLITTKE